MSGFYVLKDAGTLEGIDGQLVRQEQHDIPNGASALEGELARAREPFDIAGKKWLNGALVDMTDAEREALDAKERADRIATITPKLWNMAAIFVATLRQHFGANAETNHEVTAATVEQYFIDKRLAGTLTMLDLADASLLERGFEMITAWTGDGTIWSFPWEVLQ